MISLKDPLTYVGILLVFLAICALYLKGVK